MSRPVNAFCLFIALAALICFSAGCSDMLNVALAPLQPNFNVTAAATADGVRIEFQNAKTGKLTRAEAIEESKSDKNYSIFYAYYIFRSNRSPYDDFQLIMRLYNPSNDVNRIHNEDIWEIQTDDRGNSRVVDVGENKDFRLSAGNSRSALNEPFQEKATTDRTALPGVTYFYRVVRMAYVYRESEVTLRVNGNEVKRTEVTHEIASTDASGWVQTDAGNGRDVTINPSVQFIDFGASQTTQTLSFTTSGTGTINWSATKTANWLTVLPASGSVNAGGAFTINASVNRTGLAAGNYTDTITVTGGAVLAKVAVTLSVSSSGGGTGGANAYTFTRASGSYTSLSTSTLLIGAAVDDAVSTAVPIGFTFTYAGTAQTQFRVSSNGFLVFGNSLSDSQTNNSLSTAQPLLAPLWDDLATGNAGSIRYALEGNAGSRVMTIEFRSMRWNYTATTDNANFQIKLYEGTNRIEFVYGTFGTPTSPSASIGIADAAGRFLSVTPAAAPSTSTTVANNSINAASALASGTIYRFQP